MSADLTRLGWDEAYAVAQQASTKLTAGTGASERVSPFLEHRAPRLTDS